MSKELIELLREARSYVSVAAMEGHKPAADLVERMTEALAQPAAPAEGDSLLGRAFSDCAAADCFEDGVSADLHGSGIETLSDAWLAGREDFICEVRDAAEEMLAAAPEGK